MRRLMRNLGQIMILTCLLSCCLWPAIYNGGPLLDTDTEAYIRYADVAVSKLTGHPPEWGPQTQASNQPGSASSSIPEGESEAKAPFLGRSIYYGMLLRFGDTFGMMWPSIALQGAALLLTVALTLLNTSGLNSWALGLSVVFIAFTTPVAFFASRLMPDMFAGVAILATANLIIFGGQLSWACLIAWVGLLAAALLFHSTHVLIALALFALYLLGRLFVHGSASWVGLAGVLFCVLLAFAGDAAFAVATMRFSGVAPIRPPFLTARVVADGPGNAYLKASCPGSGFAVCRFTDRLPTTADRFLWASDPSGGGVFTPADPATRRALSNEQFRFFLSVLRYDLLDEATAMAKNTLDQIGRVSMSVFNINDQDKVGFRRQLPPRYLKAAEETRAWGGTMPVAMMATVVLIGLISSTAYVVSAVFHRPDRSLHDNSIEKLAKIVIIGILVNAFVCGALSDPNDRYQLRVVWLIPFVAALIYHRRSRSLTATA